MASGWVIMALEIGTSDIGLISHVTCELFLVTLGEPRLIRGQRFGFQVQEPVAFFLIHMMSDRSLDVLELVDKLWKWRFDKIQS
jgi:hypothetical protein